ncbi:MAG: O-methyltransferase [Planctomycetota bacterium]|jgi:predicted O-methyltransferase YrrM
MSDHTAVVTAEHVAYLAARTQAEDPFLADLKRAAVQAGLPAIWIAPEQASYVQVLLKVAGAKRVVEVGTLGGYSAISMARALPADGSVVTFELDAHHADFAREWVARSDVAGRVEVRTAAGLDGLPELPDGTADAMFIDANKNDYPHYVDHAARLLSPGGLLMVDNAFAFGQLFAESPSDPGVPHVRAFNDWMALDSRFHAIIAAIGDGMWIGARETSA